MTADPAEDREVPRARPTLPVDPELPDPASRLIDPRVLAVIALGGAVGAPLRYALEELHPAGAAVALVNMLANLLLGTAAAAAGLALAGVL